jgi:hypothetical protein
VTTDPDTLDARTDRDRPAGFETEARDDRPDVALRSVAVEYEDRPDRRTVYPADASGAERTSAWLTADGSAFVGLETAR